MRRAPVTAAVGLALVLHGLWWALVANGGGDLAAQDAWAGFARAHPLSAYDLAWYGGMHPGSYSVLSPYVMAVLGVRPTMVVAGVVASGLLARLIVQTRTIRHPVLPALYGAIAIWGNAVSGRVTFGLGLMFGLAALVVVFSPSGPSRSPGRQAWRGLLAALLAALATLASPVAGLFLGVVAAALWLSGRRRTAYAVGLPPVAVVLVASLLFPFSGEQPMKPVTAILPLLIGLCCALMPPPAWHTVRRGAAFYTAGVVVVLLVPSQIGSNVTRLALIFGGVVLVAVAAEHLAVARRAGVAVVAAVLVATVWQAGVATADVVNTRSASAWSAGEVAPLVRELRAHDAEVTRVEVVPTRSHREASALAPYVNLARGWNRQADAARNRLFYSDDDALDAGSYRRWLDRWGVRFVLLPHPEPDPAALAEAELIKGGLPYLHLVWAGAGGRLYEVVHPTPLVAGPAVVTTFAAGEIVVVVPEPGSYRLRVLSSPWLALLDPDGHTVPAPTARGEDSLPVNTNGCLDREEEPATVESGKLDWAVLEAPHAGTYRISTPYAVPRGTACPAVTASQR
ncbi:MAG: MFS transporter [Marmoricola sp.]